MCIECVHRSAGWKDGYHKFFSHGTLLLKKESQNIFIFSYPSKRWDHESKKQQPGQVLPVVAMFCSICTSYLGIASSTG